MAGWDGSFRFLKVFMQMDPSAHSLFGIVADVFSLLADKGFEHGCLQGFVVGSNSIRINHLQFAKETKAK